jgi:hypothetical protein
MTALYAFEEQPEAIMKTAKIQIQDNGFNSPESAMILADTAL